MRPNNDHEGHAPAGAIETLVRKVGGHGGEERRAQVLVTLNCNREIH